MAKTVKGHGNVVID